MYVRPLGDPVMRGWVHIGYDGRGWFVGVAIAVTIGFYVAIRGRHIQCFADPSLMAATARKSRSERAPRLDRCNATRHLVLPITVVAWALKPYRPAECDDTRGFARIAEHRRFHRSVGPRARTTHRS